MGSPNQNTYDLVPSGIGNLAGPRRPGNDDFNGIAKIDRPGREPDPQTQPNAPEWNQKEHQILANDRVTPVLVLSVANPSGTPSVYGFGAKPSTLSAGTFSFNRTSAGVVEVTWPANTFPPPIGYPRATPSSTSMGANANAEPITNGVRVRTAVGTTATDMNFVLEVF